MFYGCICSLFYVVPLHLIPVSKCLDTNTQRESIEVVALTRKINGGGLELVSGLVDATAGARNCENAFMFSVTKSLGAGQLCDFGAALGVFFNQFFRPQIRYIYRELLSVFVNIFYVLNIYFYVCFHSYKRWIQWAKRVVTKKSMIYSVRLRRMLFACGNNIFIDKMLGVVNSDVAGLIFDSKSGDADS